eukprot:148745-Hanusia_phi.AAC.1
MSSFLMPFVFHVPCTAWWYYDPPPADTSPPLLPCINDLPNVLYFLPDSLLYFLPHSLHPFRRVQHVFVPFLNGLQSGID